MSLARFGIAFVKCSRKIIQFAPVTLTHKKSFFTSRTPYRIDLTKQREYFMKKVERVEKEVENKKEGENKKEEENSEDLDTT